LQKRLHGDAMRLRFAFDPLSASIIQPDPCNHAAGLTDGAYIKGVFATGSEPGFRLPVAFLIEDVAEIGAALLPSLPLRGRVGGRSRQCLEDAGDAHRGALPSSWSILSIVR